MFISKDESEAVIFAYCLEKGTLELLEFQRARSTRNNEKAVIARDAGDAAKRPQS